MTDFHMLNASLKYAAAGWPVMPLAGAVEKAGGWTCACWKHDDCISPAKHPLTQNGLFDATTSEAVIRSWFGRGVRNIGLRTGDVCDVLDVDTGGLDSLVAWTNTIDERVQRDEVTDDVMAQVIWDGPIVKTGKGYHFYLRPQQTGNRAKMLPGLDYRGAGGYVVIPPSMHVDGEPYRWLRKGQLGDAPEWLRTLLFPPTCEFVLRGGRTCAKASTHNHGDVIFTSIVDLGMEVPA